MDVRHCLLLLAVLVTSHAATHVPRSPPRIKPPAVSALPQSYYKAGASFNLPCSATGNPPPKYSWTLNGRLTVEESEWGNHTISHFYQVNEGDYQCTATNDWGISMSQVITVQMAKQGSFPAEKSVAKMDGIVGRPLKVLRVDIDCVPTPKYDWKIIDEVEDQTPEHLQRSKRVLQDIEGNLYFTSLELEDNNLYKVEVSNNILDAIVGGSYTRIHNITEDAQVEYSAPRLLYPKTPHHKITVVEGQLLRVQCIFGGRPEVAVRWKGPNNPRATLEEAGTRLRLDHVTQEDAGTYTCTGTNSMGSKSATIHVEVHTLPMFDDSGKPKNHNPAFTGDSATFKCQYSTDTKPTPIVTWMRNGREIVKGLSERTTLTGITRGKDLIMNALRREDTGIIQCKLSNEHGTIYAEATLNVFKKTTVTVKPVSAWLEPNVTEVRFTCSSSSDPNTPPPKLSWQYQGKSIDDNKGGAVQVEGGTLSITLQGTASDVKYTGAYTCTASDGLSNDSQTATLYATKEEMQIQIDRIASPMVAEASSSLMLVGMGAALLLLVVMMLAVAVMVNKNRNKGKTYQSEKRERKLGVNPLSDMERLTFLEYQRRPDRVPKASNASIQGPSMCGSDAGDSVIEYGDLTEGKFDEDGSFIGVCSLQEGRSTA